jgi:hypothetical protein
MDDVLLLVSEIGQERAERMVNQRQFVVSELDGSHGQRIEPRVGVDLDFGPGFDPLRSIKITVPGPPRPYPVVPVCAGRCTRAPTRGAGGSTEVLTRQGQVVLEMCTVVKAGVAASAVGIELPASRSRANSWQAGLDGRSAQVARAGSRTVSQPSILVTRAHSDRAFRTSRCR